MSYARKNATSDVYVIATLDGIVCLNCTIAGGDGLNVEADGPAAMLRHLRLHERVPRGCIDRLQREGRTDQAGEDNPKHQFVNQTDIKSPALPTGGALTWSNDPHEDNASLSGKTIAQVEWVRPSHYTGGSPLLRFVFTDGSCFWVDHEGDDASYIETVPFNAKERV